MENSLKIPSSENINSIVEKVKKGEITVEALVTEHLKRAHEINPKINAFRFNSLIDKEGKNIIEEIIKNQKELIDNDEDAPQILLYIDDFYDNIMKQKMGIFLDLYSQASHYNISIIQITHNWITMTPDIRRLVKNVFLFKVYDEIQKEYIARELCGNLKMNDRNFIKIRDDITDEPYSFMYINKLEKKFYKNLKTMTDKEIETILKN